MKCIICGNSPNIFTGPVEDWKCGLIGGHIIYLCPGEFPGPNLRANYQTILSTITERNLLDDHQRLDNQTDQRN
jgi:hypothetical protein